MKLLRTVSLVALAVALGVGFLASAADAAILDSVRVVTPDSGAIRGIDSLIVTEIYFRTTHADSGAIGVFWWLATKGSPNSELADGVTSAAEDSIGFAQGDTSGAGVSNTLSASFVAVRTTLDQSEIASANGGLAVDGDIDIGAAGADVDTILVGAGPAVSAGKSWKVTIRYTLDADVGTASSIAAYAAVFDKNARDPGAGQNGFTPVKAAERGHGIRVDGDRPSQATLVLSAATARGGVSVSDFTGPVTRTVLGIGDTVKIDYDLGAQADQIILAGDLKLSSTLFTKIVSLGTIQQKVDSAFVVIQSGQFGDINAGSTIGSIALYLTDPAGNLSSTGTNDVTPVGLTASANFVIDATAPLLDAAVAAGDTLLPVANDTISNGGMRTAYANDLNPVTYNLGEALQKLDITFDNADNTLDRTYSIAQTAPYSLTHTSLLAGNTRTVDLTASPTANDTLQFEVYSGTTNLASFWGADSLKTGTYTVKFQGTDVAGNAGTVVSRANVYVDVTDITLASRFPTKAAFGPISAARLDTVEEATAPVQFQLSEVADSVLITYTKLSGADPAASRTRRLAGSQLQNTTSVQTFPIDSLRSQTTYALTILARDLAGNYTLIGPDTFRYDTSFVVPILKRFKVVAATRGPGSPLVAGVTDVITITADATTDGSRDAVTFKGQVILKVTGADGVTFTGTGVTDMGGGRALLDQANWLAGQRTVTLKDTFAVDTLQVSVVDSLSAGGPFTGAVDSVIVYVPTSYSKILVSAPASVEQGEAFAVNVTLADQYGNRQITGNNKYVAVAANKLGVDLPATELYVTGGQATFMAEASMEADSLVIRVRDVLAGVASPIHGVSNYITVLPAGAVGIALDAPDTLFAEDYMGANGAGDQGGFVMLTWDLSADDASLDGYRIYREVQVNYGTDADGAVVALAAADSVFMPWAFADAVPGEDVGRAIVATLDNVGTRWAVAAERGDATTNAKEAFDGVADLGAPYELMAGTMAQSKGADLPVFATLSAEALAFIEKGVAPRMKSVDAAVRSALVETVEPVRAIDNIAPEAVAFLRASDTPSDAGSSITVVWSKSASDRLLQRSVPTAVGLGSVSDQVAGVEGYNVYRRVGEGAFSLVGQVVAGETSFADVSALNGVRYGYRVSPFDQDNVTESAVERTAVAIRNNVVDANGVPVRGLFGMDNQVGFDDFFAFADNFGLTAGDEGFEPAFDLNANARVDVEDFFVFADYFGRVAEVAGKVVPTMAGLNTDARLYLSSGADLPKVGEEVAVQLSLADFVELKGYGFSLSYDASKLEFVKVIGESDALGSGELAQPQILSQSEGEVAVAAYGEAVSEGEMGLSVVFRTKTEIEDTYVEVGASEVRDGNYAINQVALPAPLQIQTRPEAFALKDNYPNPFNPATTIKYALPEAAFVKLEIYNVVGQVVRTLVAEHQNAGRYVVQWDASNESGQNLSSGIYFYRLVAGSEFLEVKKMLLLK